MAGYKFQHSVTQPERPDAKYEVATEGYTPSEVVTLLEESLRAAKARAAYDRSEG